MNANKVKDHTEIHAHRKIINEV